MATRAKKQAPQVEYLQQPEPEREPLLDEMMYSGDSLSPALQVLYSELGFSEETLAEVFVSKDMGDAKRSWPGVWRGLPDDYDLQEIARVHGSGDYRVCVYITANGHKTKRGEKVFAWLLSAAEEAARLAPPVVAQPETITKGDIAMAVAEAMRAMAPAIQQPPAINVMQMFEMSLGMAKMMQPQQTNTDPLAMMKLFLEMQNSIKQESEPQESGKGATTNDLILGLIDKFGGPIAQIVAAGQAQQTQPMQQPQQAQQPQNIAYNPSEQVTHQSEEVLTEMQLQQAQQLKMGVAFLVEQAQQGNPHETYAEVAIDFVPAEALDEIIKQPDPVAWLAVFDPRVNEHKEWFTKMLDEVKKILSDSTEQP